MGDEQEDEGRVVGARLENGIVQRFMFWVGHRNCDCTYEENANTTEPMDLVRQTIELYDSRGTTKIAACWKHINKDTYTLEYRGKAARALQSELKRFDINLLDWSVTHSDFLGWKVAKYSEWDSQ